MKCSLIAASFLLSAAPALAADLGTYGETPYSEPGNAPSGISAVFDIMGGYGQPSNEDDSDFNEDFWEIRGSGRVNVPFAGFASAQFDLLGAYGEGYDDGSGDAHEGWGAGAHLSLRDNQNYLFGVFAGIQDANLIDTSSDESPLWMAGVEGQAHFGPVTFYGQGGYADRVDGEQSAWYEIAFVRGVARLFATPDTKLEGEVGYAWGNVEGGDSAPLAFWSASIDQRFAGTPFSAFLRYEGSILENEAEDDKLSDHAIFGGLSVAFGAPTHADQNLSGVTLDMPNFLRTIAYSDQFD